MEAWGGNAAVVGEWIGTDNYSGSSTEVTCTNGDVIPAEYSIYTKESWVFVLKANGTYYEVYDSEYNALDYEASAANCEATYGETMFENDKYDGNWAFNEEDGTLTVIDFKYTDLLDPANNEVYESGDVYFSGVAVDVSANQLILTEQGESTTFTRR
ncbi:hypothetical protein N7U66_15695 [Lacinutrix neustonica]|uniref:Uncharacterized protein n=1 Tax=Lacinutrix neustonica TaxID=2980107 RepID=A0A9E8MV03_9FLAO|nr:hypothetical protein [Lacinutrix neustonica]WAC01450.1 hypothetical protein N7U66_15695 [Lacinutrix neustonica]